MFYQGQAFSVILRNKMTIGQSCAALLLLVCVVDVASNTTTPTDQEEKPFSVYRYDVVYVILACVGGVPVMILLACCIRAAVECVQEDSTRTESTGKDEDDVPFEHPPPSHPHPPLFRGLQDNSAYLDNDDGLLTPSFTETSFAYPVDLPRPVYINFSMNTKTNP